MMLNTSLPTVHMRQMMECEGLVIYSGPEADGAILEEGKDLGIAK